MKFIFFPHEVYLILFQKDNFERYRTEVQGIPAQAQSFYSLNYATTLFGTQSSLKEWTIGSLMGRINY